MDAKFSQQLEMIRQSQKPKPDFKYVGNEHQWKFNTDIKTDLLESERLLKAGRNGKVVTLISSMLGKIQERNKMLLFADSSEGGWDNVKEYKTSDIATNSSDEKKIRAAETRAIAKKKKKYSSKPYLRPSASLSKPPASSQKQKNEH